MFRVILFFLCCCLALQFSTFVEGKWFLRHSLAENAQPEEEEEEEEQEFPEVSQPLRIGSITNELTYSSVAGADSDSVGNIAQPAANEIPVRAQGHAV
jgi:hypothetical protein